MFWASSWGLLQKRALRTLGDVDYESLSQGLCRFRGVKVDDVEYHCTEAL